jgi:tricarballylate dehydrogenase
LGAKTAGHWQGAHATPIDATFPDVEISNKANRYGYTYGITVNSLGQRFFDEGEARHSYTYAKTGWAVLAQPGAVAYQIYDQKALALLNKRYYEFSHPIEANTIEELAQKISIEPMILKRTVEEFNGAIRKDIPFDATKLDGRCTEGITPKKSHWADTLDKPPYFAYAITGGVTFTFGGLQINTRRRCGIIDNRFASVGLRHIVGLFLHNIRPAVQTRNVVFPPGWQRNAAARDNAGRYHSSVQDDVNVIRNLRHAGIIGPIGCRPHDSMETLQRGRRYDNINLIVFVLPPARPRRVRSRAPPFLTAR